MPQLTFPVGANRSLLVSVMVGASATAIKSQLAAGQPVANPILALAEIDTGANISSVSPSILQRLGVVKHRVDIQTTASGQASVDLFWISLSIIGPAGAAGPIFSVPDLEVAGLLVPLAVDVLVGMDVLLECQFHIDGPARQFSFTF